MNLLYLSDPLYQKFLAEKYPNVVRRINRFKNKEMVQNLIKKISTSDIEEKKLNQLLDALDNSGEYFVTNRHKVDDITEYYNGSKSILLEFLGDMMETGIYYQGEQGQYRNPEEKKQVLELFTYPIGVLDFAPSKSSGLNLEAFHFIEARALMKTAAWFNIKFEDIDKNLKAYYAGIFKNEGDWNSFKNEHLMKFYENC